jgi:hypothetical protein
MQGKGVQAGTFAARDEDGQDGVRFVGRTALHAEHVRRSPREEHVLQHNVCCASLLPQQLPLLHRKLHPPSKLAAHIHVGQRSSGLRARCAAIFVARACGGCALVIPCLVKQGVRRRLNAVSEGEHGWVRGHLGEKGHVQALHEMRVLDVAAQVSEAGAVNKQSSCNGSKRV